MNIMLDEEDFKCLVRGGVISINKGGVKIALSDIGFDRMDIAIALAVEGVDIGKNHEKDVIFK